MSNVADLTYARYYINFVGKCKDCSSNLVGWVNEKPKEFCPLRINIFTQDTRDRLSEHTSKRPLNGSKRQDIGKALLKDCASNWQRDATSSFDFGDSLPSNFYNKPVLWKFKQQYRDEILGITNKCPINSLIELKHSKYAGFIHTISADKFFAHYWTPHQLVVYKHLRKTYCRLCIDATGSVVKKLMRTKHGLLSSHIFLKALYSLKTIKYRLLKC